MLKDILVFAGILALKRDYAKGPTISSNYSTGLKLTTLFYGYITLFTILDTISCYLLVALKTTTAIVQISVGFRLSGSWAAFKL